MKDAQKPDHVSLNSLIGRLREGRFLIPDFQRDFEWKPWDICELMRSIFLDYYIGSLLLWKGKTENFDALSCESVYGFDGEGRPEYIVLDGQQRLTALYYAFLAPDVPLPNRKSRAIYFLNVSKFMNEEYDEAFQYEWLSKRVNKILGNQEAQFAEHIFPLSIAGEGGRKLHKWFRDYEDYWKEEATKAEADGDEGKASEAREHAVNADNFAEYASELIEQYQVSYIELDKELAVDKVCDIFTQINSRGVRLDVFDLMNAMLVPKGLQLKHMWRAAESRLQFAESDKMNVYVLQVMSILRQTYCSPKYLYYLLPNQPKVVRDPDGKRRSEVLIPDAKEFEGLWHKSVKALEDSLNRLSHPQEFGVASSQYLPYVSILPVFAAMQTHVRSLPAGSQLDGQRKIRHWYWASVFLNRYSGSVESTAARDFLDMKSWLEDDALEPALIQEFNARYRSLELRKEVKRGSSVYNGIFNLLVLAGARDWVTGNIPHHGELDDHHIVPASWGKKNIKSNLINSILNRTPLSADTNRHIISDKLPNEYLPDLIEKSGEKAVRGILETHFISSAALAILLRNPFTPDDFEEFIQERQRTIQDAIEDLLVKERLDLPPNLRELDAQVEDIELSLRRTIVDGLDDDASQLPPHIAQKSNDLIQRALKKNAALDSDYFESLAGMLEFTDLRGLQDTIASKTLWAKFQDRFANKETLFAKFGQLAELRNSIAHNRTVDEVPRKEGEAALIWFRQVLEK
ncbi:MAG: DUF262 domain-containing protein [Candidatus Thiodiazotropha endolucinida]